MTNTEIKQIRSWSEVVTVAIGRGQAEGSALKQDRSRARRTEIVSAAVRIFARDGIARARIADIAAEAGVPLSSLYDYYGTKEDIAYAVPIKHMSEFFSEFAQKAQAMSTARARLHLFLWLTADFARRNKDWARMLYLEVWPSVLVDRARVRMSLDDYGLLVVELIHQGERDAEWPVDPRPYETVNIFIGSINQLIITWLLYQTPRNLMEATESLVQRLLSMLTPPVASPGAASASQPKSTVRQVHKVTKAAPALPTSARRARLKAEIPE